MDVTVCFDPDGEKAALVYGPGHMTDLPLMALNPALGILQDIAIREQDGRKFFVFAVNNGYQRLGLLLDGNFDPDEGDLGDAEIRAFFDRIVSQNEHAPLGGELEPFTVNCV